MSDSPSKAAIARVFLLAGALLALLLFASPQPHVSHAQSLPNEAIDYAEGDTAPVEAYTAVDPEDKSIVWTRTGADAEGFTIDGGVLQFVRIPDYEDPHDDNEDNVYEVTVSASDGSTGEDSSGPSTQILRITILNLEERGTVTLSARQPQVGSALRATLTDPDGASNVIPPVQPTQTILTEDTTTTWTWARSRNGTSGWTDIEVVTTNGDSNPDGNVYTPVEDDEGYFLRATATYKDGESADDADDDDKPAEFVSDFAVRPIPYLNTPPEFLNDDGKETDATARSVAENSVSGAPVGAPVQATDEAETGPDVLTYTLGGTNADDFDIDSGTGQIKVKAGESLDHETDDSYTVTVTATDPSGLNDVINVTITVTDVNETPVVTVDGNNTERTPDENPTTTTDTTVATFIAMDEEDASLTWSLSGADMGDFDISTGGALTFKSAPDYEAPTDANRNNVYEVTAQASDGVNTGSLDITVTVGNIEEPGVVTLSNLQPEDGVPITATLTDPDGVVRSSVEWQWKAGNTNISRATSATFKPDTDEQGDTLTAEATYTDGDGPSKTAEKESANPVQLPDTTNARPEFQDDNGASVSSYDRSVAENAAADATVGAPVDATDEKTPGTTDDSNLTYSLSGSDAGSFKIDRATGQISVRAANSLDYETKPNHTVTVRVEDPSRATDTVTVNIAVTNFDEDPEITAGPTTENFAEKGTGNVATYTATDPEDDSARPRKPLSWSLTGNDSSLLTVEGGVLKFKNAPDFESAQDNGNDNDYNVTVTVTDSDGQTDTRAVIVTVTNVKEAGTVTLSAQQPQVGVVLTASLTDPDDGVTDESWQWAKSRTRSSGWTDIEDEDDATFGKAATYTPVEDDVGYYLRATVTYKDDESADDDDKPAEFVSPHQVRKEPYENSAPVFQDDEGEEIPTDTGVDRSVAENSAAGTAVGDPVAATDPGEFGPDTLTYELGVTDAASFNIDSGTGQIKVKAGESLDHETDDSYTVTVTATDPSGLNDVINVTITVTDVDETPTITEGSTEVDHMERDSSEPDTYAPELDTYMAADPEDDIADPPKPLKWSVAGIDGNKFNISDSGALTFMTPPDHEAPVDSGRNNVYTVRVEVTDSGGNTATRVVTVTVVNIDEPGVVTQSNLQPEDGKEIRAGLTDPDGSISGITWQWATSTNVNTTPIEQDHIDNDNATLATYTPISAHVSKWLWAIASYTDGQGQDKKTAMQVSGYPVRAADTVNETPMFPDQDDETEGEQTDQTRTIPEDTDAGDPVGAAVTAMDADAGAQLTYTLSGVDQGSFGIGRKDGQITVGDETKLNYESKDTYEVGVTATDSHGASATATVTITLTDVDEPPELSKKALVVVGDERVDYLEGGTDTVETYRAAGPDSLGARWRLSGTDAIRFALSNGVLSFRSPPDFEAPTDSGNDNVYNVIVQASKGSLQDSRNVTIKVTNKEETGAISLSTQQPDVGVEITATLSDPDGGVTGERWQWARSPDGTTRWSDIPAASTSNYTPVLADSGLYLRVTVTYTDAQGPTKNADAITTEATGVDNDGVVTLSSATPQIGVVLTASLTDPDGGVTGEAWQWARSADGIARWEDIAAATSNAYAPVAADVGYYLRATVSYDDADGTGDSAHAVTDNAVPENTAPVFPATETGARSVAENTAAGENIGGPVAATDPDAGDALTYSLGGDDADSFDIDGTTGQLMTRAALDYETRASYSVEVTADDGNGGTDTIDVTITVTDVDENVAPAFAAGTDERSVAENTAAGENIGAAVAATDADDDTLTYTLGGADAASFDIDGTTGQLMTKAALDYETRASYSVEVTADDGNGGTDTIDVTITVTDVNEAPEFPAAETGARNVAENTVAGENIGDPVAASDPDAGDTLTYTLGGDDADSFDIDDTTGQLMTKAALDYETKASYSVEVTADDGNGGTATIGVTITVTDVTTGNAAGDAYDSNEDGTIDVEEALDAVDAYFDGDLDLEGALDVIDLYFDSRANG